MTGPIAGENRVQLIGDTAPFVATLDAVATSDGIEEIILKLKADSPALPPTLKLLFEMPCWDIHSSWAPFVERDRHLQPFWNQGFNSHATSNSPVVQLQGGEDRNRVTIALSDALNPVRLRAHYNSENGCCECGAVLFEQVAKPMDSYDVTLRIDRRDIPFFKALDDVRAWWEDMPAYRPTSVPDTARRPLYSTNYSLSVDFTAQAIEEQCRLAKQIGCESVIVDHGWEIESKQLQMDRLYADCGDGEVFKVKIPDMRAHVARIHDVGLKYILWYTVPFIGVCSRAYQQFESMLVRPITSPGRFAVLDPRYPETREYIINMYEQAIRNWDLDGFKLDFVDWFLAAADAPLHPEKTDYLSIPEAADRLLSDAIARLKGLKPDICIEFRQRYTGPLMRKYGNMFRSADVPGDAVQNRVHVIDIRLLAGNSATHADMLMWHNEEPAEAAALQLLNVLFSVPQISVRLDKISPEQRKMLEFWLGFWTEHRSLLLDAAIEPGSPQLLYPCVSSQTEDEGIIVSYGDKLLSYARAARPTLFVVNASGSDGLYLSDAPVGVASVVIMNTIGTIVGSGDIQSDGRPLKLDIPRSGLAIIQMH